MRSGRTPASLCILTCNQVEAVRRLIKSFVAFEKLDIEVCIGDNSTVEEASTSFKELADVYRRVHDSEVWFDGFGICKQQIVNSASNDLVIIADPDEEWHPASYEELLDVEGPRVYRTLLIDDGRGVTEHGRIFDRRVYRLMGMIHEELYDRRTRASWSSVAPKKPFANIFHSNGEQGPLYMERKKVLYDNILDRIHKDPSISVGTRVWWHREYWPARLQDGFTPTSFKDWSEKYRGV